MDSRVDVIIPAYNERDRIESTVNAVKNLEYVERIIVVDDASGDGTADIAEKLDVTLVRMKQNGGKGKAIREGLKLSESEAVALLDGDLGSSAGELSKLIAPVIEGDADFTIAKFGKAKKKGGFGLVKQLAKRGVYFYTKQEIDTTLSGQRVYRREVIDSISYIPDRFGIEVAMTVEALRQGYKLVEVEVDMTHAETGRDISGFVHRGRQFWDILKTLIVIPFKR
ncbi:poly-beta-1,6-N-acetyl-D-glucosamine synthase [Andreesenia angusta]|uniref:Poly-beta-1,6-N-acetyl-D-glucosamine synthase n=1 Tax=Andreesenia angusta TaxID=39480 RepID=A0A1S1V8Q8_9FIRM|nr:glycosyltransferase family 2 protein [Andreesenia angusta]OHW62978.1 poly-beta-1,6-N-acetyl-D-glucosamine synthase [Andreesenia angusta]